MSKKLTLEQEARLALLIEEALLERPLTKEKHEELTTKVLNA